MSQHLAKYVQYIKNTGMDTKLTTKQFDDDWEPIGPMVRRDMQAAGLITVYGGKISLVQPAPGNDPSVEGE